ncbi:PD-(D/E)XK nuclease family protein [Thermodesulfobacteriota bacterium]
MRVLFGTHLDGYNPPKPKAVAGEVIAGPRGLLGILETRLGLGAPISHESLRIIEFLHCLKQCDNGKRFYSRSLLMDELAVAKTLLHWRDIWIEAGWNGQGSDVAGRRISDMAAVEVEARKALSPGIADRIWKVIARLEQSKNLDIKITYLSDISYYPYGWQQILSHLPAEPDDKPVWLQKPSASGNDLGKLQHSLITGTQHELSGDGSVQFLTANSEMTCAKTVAGILADEKKRADTTIISEGKGDALEISFQGMDVPMAGLFSASALRPHLQVLPLSLSLIWRPLDPYRLLEFLVNPVSPLPRYCRQKLAGVVTEYPGVGSKQWQKALEEIQESAVERDDDADSAEKIADLLDKWLPGELFDPEQGAPVKVVAERCALISRWAVARAGIGDGSNIDSSLFKATGAQAGVAAKALDEMFTAGQTHIPRLQLNRLIDQVTAAGTKVSDNSAEVNRVHMLRGPGCCFETNETVIWWNFTEPVMPRNYPWDNEEIKELEQLGAHLTDTDQLLNKAAEEWQRPILAATRQLILAAPRISGTDPVKQHPLWSRIATLTSETVPVIVLDDLMEPDQQLRSLVGELKEIEIQSLYQPRRWWQISDPALLDKRGKESYSSLNTFIESPYQWVLNYKARIRPGSLAELQGDNRQKGNLLHRLLEEFFSPAGCDWQNESLSTIADWVNGGLTRILETEGANYLLPGKTTERERLFEIADRSVRTLVNHLKGAGIVSVSMEKWENGLFCGGEINGYIDMLVCNESGREAVIDIKFGGGKYRANELLENRHLQLALYAHLRRGKVQYWPEQAYFILEESRLLSQSNSFFPNAEIFAPPDDEDVSYLWQQFEETWKWRREQLDTGKIEMTVSGTIADEDSIPPDDGLYIDEHNDRFNDYATITGIQEEL